ncbi:SPOR domain-containing protein [Endozoicomonas ascidiicola]|uniref:SPOR domain-containing protein n=1 Tax=Endozoicomonas ascidiicola TaxID=1698521 RepID=UPI000832B3C7|nr:SPOR domain-containing protein [Endozoicomonas ascidiicola]
MFLEKFCSHLFGLSSETVARSALLVCLLTLFPIMTVADNVLLNNQQSLPFNYRFDGQTIERGTELIVSGINSSDEPEILVVRIDNEQSSNYYSRNNREFTLAPGPFNLTMPLTGLKTSSKRPLGQPYTEMIIFTSSRWTGIKLNAVVISKGNSIPDQTMALDFGSSTSPVFPGFEPIEKNHSFIKGAPKARARVSGDALIRDGISGINQVQIPWPDGQWKVSLWTQDQGEWEYLPHFLNRSITVNNTSFLQQKYSPSQWISEVYLAGRQQEAGIDGDLWSLVGERRDGFISEHINVSDGLVTINLAGDFGGKFLSGLVIEAIDGIYASQIQKKRQERFLNKWPVVSDSHNATGTLLLEDISQQTKTDDGFYPVAKNTVLNLLFEIKSPVDDIAPVLAISPPKNIANESLEIAKRYGHWHFERPYPNATSLTIDDSYLRSDLEQMQLSSQKPRRLHIQVHIPKETHAGNYFGKVQLFSQGELKVLDYQLKVLPMALPDLEAPVGLYLEPAPYYQWFATLAPHRAAATACDLSLLASHGFSTVAPALATPDNEKSRERFIEQLQQLKDHGFTDNLLAYSPLKRLLAQKNIANATDDLAALKGTMTAQGLPSLYWSIFDEPLPEKFQQIKNTGMLLDSPELQMKTAGHMNNGRQDELAVQADLLLINHGINVAEDTIDRFQENSEVWLYNLPRPRLASGFYLWRSGADGYLQWHGRMPTADPFDPTDGREGDMIYLYPSPVHCSKTPDIHHRFLDLHEATLDLRWLQWLENEAQSSKTAKKLIQKIEQRVTTDWLKAEQELSKADVLRLRAAITKFALIQTRSLDESQGKPVTQAVPKEAMIQRLPISQEPVEVKMSETKQIAISPTRSNSSPVFYLQAGSYQSARHAANAISLIEQAGFNAYIENTVVNGTSYKRVIIGPELSLPDVNKVIAKLKGKLQFTQFSVNAGNKNPLSFFIHAGSYQDKNRALSVMKAVRESGFNAYSKTVTVKGNLYHRVFIGPELDLKDINIILEKFGGQLPLQQYPRSHNLDQQQ